MKKSDLIKLIQENKLDVNTQNIEKANSAIEKFKSNVKQLQDMGVFEEDFDAAKNYDSNTEFFMDIIDSLMDKKFGLTYFKEVSGKSQDDIKPEIESQKDAQMSIDFPEKEPFDFNKKEIIKPISQMSNDELNDLLQSRVSFGRDGSLNFIINLIKKGVEQLKTEPELENSTNHPLRQPYIALQDLMKKNLEENFADSKIFTIIAEAETPKISKKEILEYLNRK
jgi:hypothetical protein